MLVGVKILATVLVSGLCLAACGGDQRSGTVSLGGTSTSAAPSVTTVTTTTTPATATTGARPPASATTAPTASTAAPPEDLSGFQTEPFRHEHALSVPPVPEVVAVRAASHSGFDRVVFDIDGPLPAAVSVRYVDQVVADGSGAPVAVAGRAYLQVAFDEAQAHTDTGVATIPSRSQPGLPAIEEVVVAGDFEGHVTIALGLAARVPFRILELGGPTRVVVDVRAP